MSAIAWILGWWATYQVWRHDRESYDFSVNYKHDRDDFGAAMSAEDQIKLDEVRRAVQELRFIHHTLRHPHIAGCVECISLEWLKDNGF